MANWLPSRPQRAGQLVISEFATNAAFIPPSSLPPSLPPSPSALKIVMTVVTKTVLVTGATRGIGLKFAELYIKLGWNVIGAARDLAKADQLRALSPYKIVQLDTSDEASILSAAKELDGEAIDVLINNAGILLPDGSLDGTTKQALLTQFDVNCVGPFLVTRAFLPHLKCAVANNKNGMAHVAQISSYLGSITLNDGAYTIYYGYSASKAALNMVNASLAADLKSDGIAAVAIHPGYVATDINGSTGEISTETSASGMISLIDKLTLADTGKFYDYNGETMPW